MTKVTEAVKSQSNNVDKVYEAQTKAFSEFEFGYLTENLRKNNCKSILDVGTGEGNFIYQLSNYIPEIQIAAIDVDEVLISKAIHKYPSSKIKFENESFNFEFASKRKYDGILARFSVEHMSNIDEFSKACNQALVDRGVILITEWFIDHFNTENELWRTFRNKELKLYKRYHSHPRLATRLPGLLKRNGFKDITQDYRHISNNTINNVDFYNLVIEYLVLYNKIDTKIFDKPFTDELLNYAKESMKNGSDFEDTFIISHTKGIKGSTI